MLSESLSTQVSGNEWPHETVPMLYEEHQQVSSTPRQPKQRDIFMEFEGEMLAFQAEHEAEVAELRRHYIVPDDCSKFLSEHRSIPQMLLTAAPRLKILFGETTIFVLRAPTDESGARTLYAVALWPGGVKEVKRALDKFDDIWWIANSKQASGNLFFTYELV